MTRLIPLMQAAATVVVQSPSQLSAIVTTVSEIIIASGVVLGIVWAVLKWAFLPHFKDLITNTVAPLLGGVPTLTLAVENLAARMELMEKVVPSLADTAKAAAEVVATAAAAAKTAADAAATAADAILATARRRANAQRRAATAPVRQKKGAA